MSARISRYRFKEQWPHYIQLMRLDRPIGTLLLLWPTLWSLWFAAKGFPHMDVLLIFCAGVVLMRSAGCVINDYADRNFDGHVERTQLRPLATGKVSSKEALVLFAVLLLAAFLLVLMTNAFTIWLSLGGVALATVYPFMKRHTYLPQVVLGAAFAWSVPMAYAAQTNALDSLVWLIYLATLLWTVAYDTQYAMVDREDDLKIGIKSTAILFGKADRLIIALLQTLTILTLWMLGMKAGRGSPYFVGVTLAAVLFVYQQHLIMHRHRADCFKAFLNNHWAGMVIFAGILIDYQIY
ncbi:MAG: 4-hydroxybenzoate octaprenyltransferase [Hahellaceae bacterium]|nr:4-hydroxybenzoate octaprenyltransferase [Hahellaceae bacterium]MCP5170526.1 4-hydroxybenzoate octaprenyltransferase [Hahellaceae bacterium]